MTTFVDQSWAFSDHEIGFDFETAIRHQTPLMLHRWTLNLICS